MRIADLNFACQTYSWQMSIDRYRGEIEHMAATAAGAGFKGFEPELVMLGDNWTASQLQQTLGDVGISLAALVLVEPWSGPIENDLERADAERVIETVAALGGSKIVLCPLPGTDRGNLRERQDNAMACMAAVAKRAADVGVACTFHPNSPAGSVFRTAEDYRRMADLLPAAIGYTPDLGHIARGGMDPLTIVQQWRDRVDHVHVKDLGDDGWAQTGTGHVNIPAVLEYLARSGFDGWITFEDESPEAERDPDNATARNGDYVRNLIKGAA